jgi:small GTP-binding protein
MYDYLAKIILLGPSGCGKSCLLHRFVKNEWRVLSSQTIGVEFASKILKIGGESGTGRRKRIKFQLWDTAGTERFRSVSRSYYRGAAGAILVYDMCDRRSFAELGTFLGDARALASPMMSAIVVGNKLDLVEGGVPGQQAREVQTGGPIDVEDGDGGMAGSLPRGPSMGTQLRATVSTNGREVSSGLVSSWASQNRIPAAMEVSALSGDGVQEVFEKLARIILTKIELGEIDPDDPMSGIQYGDADYYRYNDDGSSIKSGGGLTSDGYGNSVGRRKKKGGWGDVFKVGARPGSSNGGSGRRGGCC